MSRFAPAQADLFAPAAPPPPSAVREPPVDPVAELKAVLAQLRSAATIPWPTYSEGLGQELRLMRLAEQAGEEGREPYRAIGVELWRLHGLDE